MQELNNFFCPKSIAIVGVSQTPTKIGSVILSNLVHAGYQGKIFPINPKYKELHGFKSYSKVSDIPVPVDLVVIAIPAEFVTDVIKDAGKKRVKAAVIISAGFKEIGEDGAKLEEELLDEAKKAGIHIIGPNCLGLMVPNEGINVSFAASSPLVGNISFLSQSGAFCTAILDMSLERNIGFSHFVSLGNTSDINENSILEDWFEDKKVKVIGAYLEEIADGQILLDLATRYKGTKPLIIYKAGKTKEAKKAISSHTGALAGSIETFDAVAAQTGIIATDEINNMFNLMMGFSWSRLPKGKHVAVVTNAGGPGIMATDEIIKSGLQMAPISPETKKKIQEALPPTASVINPVDVIGDALAERYKAPIDILINDENVDAILVILTPQLVTQIEETAKLIINCSKTTAKPIFAVFLGGKYITDGVQRLYDNKIPTFKYIEDAVKVLVNMYKFGQTQLSTDKKLRRTRMLKKVGKGKYKKEVEKYIQDEVIALPEELTQKIAQEVGLTLPKQQISHNIEEAIIFAEENYPVVIKATTEVLSHKVDEKAIYLNLKNSEDLKTAYSKLEKLLHKKFNQKEVQILIQEQIKAEEELFIGANRDGDAKVYEEEPRGFGHLLAFGKGGIYIEVYKDIAYALVPATTQEIKNAINKTKIIQIIGGARGKKALPLDKIINAIKKTQKMTILYPEIASLDINPLLVTTKDAVAVDVKVFVSKY